MLRRVELESLPESHSSSDEYEKMKEVPAAKHILANNFLPPSRKPLSRKSDQYDDDIDSTPSLSEDEDMADEEVKGAQKDKDEYVEAGIDAKPLDQANRMSHDEHMNDVSSEGESSNSRWVISTAFWVASLSLGTFKS